jgi:hypothetical protein
VQASRIQSGVLCGLYWNRSPVKLLECHSMCNPPDNQPGLSPPEQLARTKQIVAHFMDTWPVVLRRQTLLQKMGRSDDLRQALQQTHAAHIHNMMQDVLVIDLIREIGALVLDDDKRSGSVRRAVATLRNEPVLQQLKAEYQVVPPPPRMFGDELTPEQREAADQIVMDSELKRNLKEFDRLHAELEKISEELFNSEVGKKLLVARNKGVAHYDVVQVGEDWRMWRAGDTGLTYGEIDRYVSLCTKAVDTLNLFVRRASYMFEEAKKIADRYVDEYVEALIIGLRQQRRDRDEERERVRQTRFDRPPQ